MTFGMKKLQEQLDRAGYVPVTDDAPKIPDEVFAFVKAFNDLMQLVSGAPPKPKGAVHFGIANFEDQPDSQTAQIREIASKRERDSGEA